MTTTLPERLREALILAQGVLVQWQNRYAEWSEHSGPQMERAMDRRLRLLISAGLVKF